MATSFQTESSMEITGKTGSQFIWQYSSNHSISGVKIFQNQNDARENESLTPDGQGGDSVIISSDAKALYESSQKAHPLEPAGTNIDESAEESAENAPTDSRAREPVSDRSAGKNGEPLTDEEEREVIELQRRDAEVHAHEQAHLAAAGPYANGGPQYEYDEGPDGKRYAVGGEVQISIPDGRTSEETIRIAMQVERAALAPAEPSSQDRSVAAGARGKASDARQEMAEEDAEEADGAEDDSNATSQSGAENTEFPVPEAI